MEALLLATFAGALLGFLVYNSSPASIFMGDCGSMFIGFFAALALGGTFPADDREVLVPVLAVPILAFVHSNLRHDFRHDTQKTFRSRSFAGRTRSHVASAGRAGGLSERHATLVAVRVGCRRGNCGVRPVARRTSSSLSGFRCLAALSAWSCSAFGLARVTRLTTGNDFHRATRSDVHPATGRVDLQTACLRSRAGHLPPSRWRTQLWPSALRFRGRVPSAVLRFCSVRSLPYCHLPVS